MGCRIQSIVFHSHLELEKGQKGGFGEGIGDGIKEGDVRETAGGHRACLR